MEPGSVVRVLPPFAQFFPGDHVVERVEVDGSTAWLVGIESAFDFKFLEVTS